MNADVKPLTDLQRQHLCGLIYDALLEVRYHGWAGRAEQATDLADAFHNLPSGLWRKDFSLQFFRDSYLVPYETKYPNERTKSYAAAVDRIIAMTA